MALFTEVFIKKATALLDACKEAKINLATAESCTGGMVAALMTEIPGAADIFERGFVTYSNSAKTEMLGVTPELIAAHGAVSEQVAQAMAEGALQKSYAQLAVSLTGIAGPSGGSEDKPVGLVYIATAHADKPTQCKEYRFKGDRHAVRLQSVEEAIRMLMAQVA